jgi:hypothetical protein
LFCFFVPNIFSSGIQKVMVGRAEKYSKKLLKKIWVVFKVGIFWSTSLFEPCKFVLGFWGEGKENT